MVDAACVFVLPWVLVFRDIQEVQVHQVYPEMRTFLIMII